MAIRKIVSRSIGTDVIAAEDLAANSITVAEIQDGAVTAAKLSTTSVTDKLGYTPTDNSGDEFTGTVILSNSDEFSISGGSTTGYHAATLRSHSDNNTNNGASIGGAPYTIGDPPTTALGVWSTSTDRKVYVGGGGWGTQSASTQISLYTTTFANTSNGGFPRLTVWDEGYVTTPYNPHFHYTGGTNGVNGNWVITKPSGAVVSSSDYSTSTGRFTAPIQGRYIFGVWGLMYPAGTNTCSFRWLKNGVTYGDSIQHGHHADNPHFMVNITQIISLSVGDYVEFAFLQNNSTNAYGSQWNQWGTFIG